MAYVAKRGDSSVEQFRMRVPRKVLPRVKGRKVLFWFLEEPGEAPIPVVTTIGEMVKCSLKTRDKAIAERRILTARSHFQRVFEAAEKGPVTLSHKNLVALSRGVYDLFIQTFEEDPGSPNRWAAFKAFTRAAMEGRINTAPPAVPIPGEEFEVDEEEEAEERFGAELTAGVNASPPSESTDALEERFGRITDWILTHEGIEIDGTARVTLLRLVARAALDAGWQLKRNAAGDYTPDPAAARFPVFDQGAKGAPAIALTDLFERWQRETKPAGSTVTTWTGVVRSLRDHVGHDTAHKITTDDVIGWKDALVARGLTTKTIADSHLACVRTIYNYGVKNRLVMHNPAVGVRVAGRKKRPGQGMLAYTDDEAARLLALAKAETRPARRWLPWLAALSGARIGELAQLSCESVRITEGIHVIEIRPALDGGSVKNVGSERIVPVHPALVRDGFLEFVKSKRSGPLFYNRNRNGRRHASKGPANRVSEWIREQGFDNPRVAPSHGLRHWWKSAAHKAGLQDSIADAIQGHAQKADAATYRHFDLVTLYRAVAAVKVPGEARRVPIRAAKHRATRKGPETITDGH